MSKSTGNYVVEFNDEHNTKYTFPNAKEAYAFKECMCAEWKLEAQVYPEEPKEFPGMCECCGNNVCMEDAFICEECFQSVLLE